MKEFTVYYDFDTETAAARPESSGRANYAIGISASKVEVMGYRGTSRLTDGTDYVEYPWIAEHRAKVIGETLGVIGVPTSALGIPPAGFHPFRHVVASELIDSGAPIKVVQAQLRHSDPRITLGLYGHVVPQSQRDAAKDLAERLEANC